MKLSVTQLAPIGGPCRPWPKRADSIFNGRVDAEEVAGRYLKGIYRDLDERYRSILFPVVDEEAFRLALIELILSDLGVEDIPAGTALDVTKHL